MSKALPRSGTPCCRLALMSAASIVRIFFPEIDLIPAPTEHLVQDRKLQCHADMPLLCRSFSTKRRKLLKRSIPSDASLAISPVFGRFDSSTVRAGSFTEHGRATAVCQCFVPDRLDDAKHRIGTLRAAGADHGIAGTERGDVVRVPNEKGWRRCAPAEVIPGHLRSQRNHCRNHGARHKRQVPACSGDRTGTARLRRVDRRRWSKRD